jgi:hypothetical protein
MYNAHPKLFWNIVEKVWDARYTLGTHYLSKNMVIDVTYLYYFLDSTNIIK